MKLKKWLSQFLAVVMLLSVLPVQGSIVTASTVSENGMMGTLSGNTAASEEAEPKDESFGGFGEDDMGVVGEGEEDGIDPQSLLNLKEVYASLILNQYSQEQLKAVSLEMVLDNLKDRDGNKIEISKDAQIVWGYYKKENGDRIDDEFHKIGRGETVDLSVEYEWNTSYEMQMIVGSGAQLDAENIRYIVRVYVNQIQEYLNYEIYTEEESENYRNSIYNIDTAYAESSLLKDISIPVTEVSYYVQSDSRYYQKGDTCYLGIRSNIAGDANRKNIKVDVYPMAKFVEYRQNGGQLQGAITEQILNQEELYTEGGYEGTYQNSVSNDPLSLDNLFCMVYSDAETGAILAYQGILFVIRTNEPPVVEGRIYAYENGQMKEISTEKESTSSGAGWQLDLRSDPGDGMVEYYAYSSSFYLKEGYSSDAEYYYVIDENDQIDKVVRGIYNSREEAERKGAEDITSQVLPVDRSAAPYGYKANYQYDKDITVFFKDGMSVRYYVYVYETSTRINDEEDIYFNVYGAKGYNSSDVIFKVGSSLDSYYKYNRQTLLIHDKDVDLSKLAPFFTCGDKMKAYVGTEQISGESIQDFSHGPVQYSVRTDKDVKNYWITFVKKESGPKLFVNGPDEREVFLTEYFENRHDILIANVGDEALTGLKVELQNPVHIKLDDYWVVGGEKNETLAAFTKTSKSYYDENYTQYGVLDNLAKIRLLPDGDGVVTGTLKISADNQEPVYIKLKGYAGNPKIVTENLSDAVKYVPYSFVIATNNMLDSNKVTFSLKGKLPEGVTLNPNTGELYGVPQESGEFPITVRASYSRSEFKDSVAELTLTVRENTNDYVYGATDAGYEIREHIGREETVGTHDYVLSKKNDQLFVSAGEFPTFVDLWLNGAKLVEGEDYTKESGSTRITIRSQTFANKANQNGTNTLAAEFREGDGAVKDLRRTAQNFRIDYTKGDSSSSGSSSGGSGNKGSSGNSGGGSGSSAGGSNGGVVSTASNLATFVMRLVDTNGNPLSGLTAELHSTPKVTKTNANGIAVFYGVESGAHTLYIKDSNGNVLASRSLEILFGDSVSLNGGQLIVKAGRAFTLNAQMNGSELMFLDLNDGDLYQVVSAETGDDTNIALWLILLLLSCGVGYGAYISYKKKKQYS